MTRRDGEESRRVRFAGNYPRSYKNNNSGSSFASSCAQFLRSAIDNSVSRLVEYHWKAIVNQPRSRTRRRNIYFLITKELSEKREQLIFLKDINIEIWFSFSPENDPEWTFLPLVRLRVTNILTLFSHIYFFWSEYPKTNIFYQYVYI